MGIQTTQKTLSSLLTQQPVITTTVDEYYAEILKRVLQETTVYDVLFQNPPKYILSKDRVLYVTHLRLTENYETVLLHHGPRPSLDAMERVLSVIGLNVSRGGGESKNSIFVKTSHGENYHCYLTADFT